ncbi:hypothetical protein [Nocardioides sp. Arc9.136]|uniref:hypothetical protein n=1 Tax=Nocardioides sp. Arc9.136 TaxID=2996826 RepID=UPI002665F094|nr:hypothetical protein [Nocardioides sp. Arc9.136]WKN50259.1 hypothetical protein OSR43_09065 [Nocardioides sp. Arc9.136]
MVSSRDAPDAGGRQSVVVEDVSAQYDTTQRPAPATATACVVWARPAVVSARLASSSTGAVGDVPL